MTSLGILKFWIIQNISQFPFHEPHATAQEELKYDVSMQQVLKMNMHMDILRFWITSLKHSFKVLTVFVAYYSFGNTNACAATQTVYDSQLQEQ